MNNNQAAPQHPGGANLPQGQNNNYSQQGQGRYPQNQGQPPQSPQRQQAPQQQPRPQGPHQQGQPPRQFQQGQQPQQAPQRDYGSTDGPLENVLSYSFSGNHLFEVSLVKQEHGDARKKRYFCFLKLLPGGKNGNDRTYISDKHITMKLGLDRVLETANAFAAYSRLQHAHFGPFATFTDTSKAGSTSENTNAGKKTLSLFVPPVNQGDRNGPKIMLNMGLGSDKYSFPMSPYLTGAIAKVLEKVALKGMDLEFERQVQWNRTQQNRSNSPRQ